MRMPTLALICTAAFAATATATAKPLKVFISVDMEGIGGVVILDQVLSATGKDYDRFRRLMTAEANAAIDGAVDAGAAQIMVNDSHGGMINLLIEDLHAPAELTSGNLKPMGMMQGIDDSYDAVIFVGYHARAGSAEGVLAHTGSGTVRDLRINGRSVSEGGMNIYAAGAVGVPVVMVAGDQVAIAQARELVPNIEGVQVKESIGTLAARSLRPEEVTRLIREGASRAIKRRAGIKPVAASLPVRFELQFTQTVLALMAEQIPTVKRIGPDSIAFVADDYLRAYRFNRVLYRFIEVKGAL